MSASDVTVWQPQKFTSPKIEDFTTHFIYNQNYVKADFDLINRFDRKKILMFCCGHDELDSKRFIFVRAKQLQIRLFLIEDQNNGLAQSLKNEGLIEKLISLNMTPRSTLLSEIMVLLKDVMSDIGSFDGSCTFWDDCVGLQARVCQNLGLISNSPLSIDIAHNKNLTRNCMRNANLPTPKSYLICSSKDVELAVQHVGLPAIVKPMYGASSLAVLKIETEEEAIPTYLKALQMLNKFYDDGEFMGFTFEDTSQVDFSAVLKKNRQIDEIEISNNMLQNNETLTYFIMEEYLDGPEVDVDMVVQNGVVLYCQVCDDWPQIEPWFAEQGNNCPSILDEKVQEEVKEMAIRTATQAMKFRNGILHVELKVTTNGPRIVEVNPRMGGGPCWLMHLLSYECDLILEQFLICLGLPSTLITHPVKLLRHVSCGEKFFEDSIVITNEFIKTIDKIRLIPNVHQAESFVIPGQKIIGIKDGFPTRCCRFIVSAESAMKAYDTAKKLCEICQISLI